MSVASEEERIRSIFEDADIVEEVARSLPEDDDRRSRLLEVSRRALANEATIRPVIAARLLGLSEKTVRTWVDAGLLAPRQTKPRLLLDALNVHTVRHILREVRDEGVSRDLLDHVWYCLEDQALLDREDLQESIQQMLRGEVHVLRPLPGDESSTID
ncbi:MAG TPA: hypothetical protein VGG75_11040 [Trebonia sp.]|jgi:DNA-binding transcriptional MerR regulator